MIKFRERDGFTLLLVAFGALFLYLTLELGRVARFVPLSVAIPTLGVLVIQLLLDLAPRLTGQYGSFEQMNFHRVKLVGEEARPARMPDLEVSVEEPHTSTKPDPFVWLVMMPVFVYLLGLLVAVPLYTLLYLRGRSREGWLFSLAAAGVMWSLPYGVFHLALRTRLYEGQLWGWLGSLI